MENNNQQPLGIFNSLFSGRLWAANRSIIPMGYVAIFILFAFSFCDFKCNVDHVGASTGSVTGYELIMGKYVEANPLLKKGAEEKEFKRLLEPIYKTYEDEKGTRVEAMRIPSNNFAIISLITAALGLLMFMFVYENYKGHIALVSGAVGTTSMVLLNSSLSNLVSEKFSYMLRADFTFAYWLTTGTFAAIAIAGYNRLKYSENQTIEEDGKIVHTPVRVISFEDFSRTNKWTIVAVTLVIGSSIILYKIVYKKDYTPEIKELAVKACDCEKEKLQKQQKNVTYFMSKVKSSTADDVSRLRNDFNTAYNRIIKDYSKCNNSIRRKYEALSTAVVGTPSFPTDADLEKKYDEYFQDLRDSLVNEDDYLNSDVFYHALDSLSSSQYPTMFTPPVFEDRE